MAFVKDVPGKSTIDKRERPQELSPTDTNSVRRVCETDLLEAFTTLRDRSVQTINTTLAEELGITIQELQLGDDVDGSSNNNTTHLFFAPLEIS
jgi:hypothetical protein